MCTRSCLDFAQKYISKTDIEGKSVLEVGAYDVNGSFRSIVEAFRPAAYVGVDMQKGPGVDIVCKAEDLIEQFGYDAFDALVSTELLEHARNWRKVVHNMKSVLRPGGTLIVTTRSIGFPYHGYPFDFWRYEIEDMKEIFSDFEILELMSDPQAPGVFMKAKKPLHFQENSLEGRKLYSVVKQKPLERARWHHILFPADRSAVRQGLVPYVLQKFPFLEKLPKPLKTFLKKIFFLNDSKS